MVGFDELRSIGKVLQEAGKIEQYQQILSAQKELLEMQKTIMDIESENKKLRERKDVASRITMRNNVYWVTKDDQEDGPFCTRCWDKNQDVIRLKPSGNTPAVYFDCPECKNMYQTQNIAHVSTNYIDDYA